MGQMKHKQMLLLAISWLAITKIRNVTQPLKTIHPYVKVTCPIFSWKEITFSMYIFCCNNKDVLASLYFLQAANSNKAGKQGKEHAGYCRHSWDMVVNKSLQTHWKKITYKHDTGLLALKSYIAHAFTHLFSQSKTTHTHAHIHNLITDTDTFSHKIMHI